MPDDQKRKTAQKLKSLNMKGIGQAPGVSFDDDTDDFTARTGETDLEPLENILDLTIFDIEFNPKEIT